MKLSHTFALFVAALPIVAISLFMSRDTGSEHADDSINRLHTSQSNLETNTSFRGLPNSGKQKPQISAAMTKYLEAKKKTDEARSIRVAAFEKIADKYTPEFCEKTADKIMNRRTTELDKFFSHMGLSKTETQNARAILRERELQRLKNLGSYFKNSSGIKNAKLQESRDLTEDMVAEEQLNLLLGEAHAKELVASIKRLERDELARAEQMLRGSDK